MNGNVNGTSQPIPPVRDPEEDLNKQLMARKPSQPSKIRGTS